jgi:hypothetical protein
MIAAAGGVASPRTLRESSGEQRQEAHPGAPLFFWEIETLNGMACLRSFKANARGQGAASALANVSGPAAF